jgi:tetratricopeptide (TPR) repeat protein
MNPLKRDLIVREPLLVSALILLTVVFSALTHAYSQTYDRRRASLGVQWFERGKLELKNNRPSAAIEDFRTALLYNPRSPEFGMQLAKALAQSGRTEQAFNYFLGLWQNMPTSGPVNLELARLSEWKGDSTSAERFFNGAIFGDWPEDAMANRRTASLELINFYLTKGDPGHAESQLIILSENVPEDAPLHIRVAELFSRVGDDRRALAQFRNAIQLDPNNLQALGEAAEASFRLGDYTAAQAYLSRLLHLNGSDSSARRLLDVIQTTFRLNPYENGITQAEKTKHALKAFDIVGNRLLACSSSVKSSSASSIDSFYERWKQLKATANPRFLSQHPDEIGTLFDFSISAEKIAESACGQSTVEDSALLAIGNQEEGERR